MFVKPVTYETQDLFFEIGLTTFEGKYFEMHNVIGRDVPRVEANKDEIYQITISLYPQ